MAASLFDGRNMNNAAMLSGDHEFTSLVLALLQTGGHPPKIDPSVIEQINALLDHTAAP